MNQLARLLTSPWQLDILWQADAHEEAGEGLGEVLSVGRAEAEAFAGVGGELGEEGFGEGEDPAEVHQADAEGRVKEVGGGEEEVAGAAALADFFSGALSLEGGVHVRRVFEVPVGADDDVADLVVGEVAGLAHDDHVEGDDVGRHVAFPEREAQLRRRHDNGAPGKKVPLLELAAFHDFVPGIAYQARAYRSASSMPSSTK